MKSLVSYFGCGRYVLHNRVSRRFCLYKLSDIIKLYLFFFEKYPFAGVKGLASQVRDFADF